MNFSLVIRGHAYGVSRHSPSRQTGKKESGRKKERKKGATSTTAGRRWQTPYFFLSDCFFRSGSTSPPPPLIHSISLPDAQERFRSEGKSWVDTHAPRLRPSAATVRPGKKERETKLVTRG